MNTTRRLTFWKIARNIVLLLIAILLFWIGFHHAMKASEQKKYPPTGQLVEVNGKNLHVYTKGEGENTIVLLSGLGTSAPVLDFEPLINELSQKNKVVVVESFGYGWSDMTNEKRTVENIVEELRLALQKSEIARPYILMPHSTSSIYSMYFANNYPEEIKAVIGMNPTFPDSFEYFDESIEKTPSFMKFVAPTGISRLLANMFSDALHPTKEEGAYSSENIKMAKAISSWKLSNKNVVDESNELEANVHKIKEMSFPSEMPMLIFAGKTDEDSDDGKSKMTFYKEQLSSNSVNKLIEIEGPHQLHWTSSSEMTKYVNEFLSEFDGN